MGVEKNIKLNQDFWDEQYKANNIGWDIGHVSTPLKEYFDQLTDKSISILIPGCGNAYEAEYLLQNGFTNITLIDISPVVTMQVKQQLLQYLNKELRIITGDFFALALQFDLVIEQTFFCALELALRPAYVQKMKSLLKPMGKLVGLLFNRTFTEGPPFGGNIDEYNKLFSVHFSRIYIQPCYNSILPRKGSEVFISVANNI